MTTGLRVVTIGECMVELSETEPGSYRMGFAGDVFNTAVYLRRLLPAGAEVRFVTATGDDWLSDLQLARMREQGVVVEAARIAGASPALYLIRTDADGERTFTYYRDASPVRQLLGPRWDDRVTADLGSATLVHLSAVTLQLLSTAARERLWDLLAQARTEGARVAFDSNFRARGWPSVAAARAAVDRTATVTDIALPSFGDERALDPGATRESVVARYRAAGVGEVVLKDGSGPVLAWADGREVELGVTAQPAVDTTGAGDAFDAGYLAHRLAGHPVEQALAGAADLAGRVVGERGAIVDAAVTEPLRIG